MLRISLACALATNLLAALATPGDFGFEDPVPVPNTFLMGALQSQPGAPEGGMVFVRLDVAKSGAQTLAIRGVELPPGDYDVFRGDFGGGDSGLGTLAIGSDGEGQLLPEPPEFGDFFEWFAYQGTVEVRQSDTVLFGGQLPHPDGGLLLDDDVHCTNGARFIAVGEDLDARGQFEYRSKLGSQRATLSVERLDPGAYVLVVGGTPGLLFDVGASGKATLKLSVPLATGNGLLAVSPVGEELVVLSHGEPVLRAQLPHDPYEELSQPASKQKFKSLGKGAPDALQVGFVLDGYTSTSPNAGSLTWRRDALGAVTLTVLITGQDVIPSPPFQLFVDGQFLSALVPGPVSAFQSVVAVDPLLNPLADLRGRRVEVRHQGASGIALIFPLSVPAAIRSYRPEVRKPGQLRLDLLNPGHDMDATGRLAWKSSANSERLTLQVADLPAGAYDIVVGGDMVAAAALVVPADGGGAKLVFSSTGSPKGSLPLDFDVAGQLQIVPAGQVAPVLLQADLSHP